MRKLRNERAESRRISRMIRDLPANHKDPSILAYGRPPFPLRDRRDEAPPFPRLRVSAWCNSPAARGMDQARTVRRAVPALGLIVLGLCVLITAITGEEL